MSDMNTVNPVNPVFEKDVNDAFNSFINRFHLPLKYGYLNDEKIAIFRVAFLAGVEFGIEKCQNSNRKPLS